MGNLDETFAKRGGLHRTTQGRAKEGYAVERSRNLQLSYAVETLEREVRMRLVHIIGEVLESTAAGFRPVSAVVADGRSARVMVGREEGRLEAEDPQGEDLRKLEVRENVDDRVSVLVTPSPVHAGLTPRIPDKVGQAIPLTGLYTEGQAGRAVSRLLSPRAKEAFAGQILPAAVKLLEEQLSPFAGRTGPVAVAHALGEFAEDVPEIGEQLQAMRARTEVARSSFAEVSRVSGVDPRRMEELLFAECAALKLVLCSLYGQEPARTALLRTLPNAEEQLDSLDDDTGEQEEKLVFLALQKIARTSKKGFADVQPVLEVLEGALREFVVALLPKAEERETVVRRALAACAPRGNGKRPFTLRDVVAGNGLKRFQTELLTAFFESKKHMLPEGIYAAPGMSVADKCRRLLMRAGGLRQLELLNVDAGTAVTLSDGPQGVEVTAPEISSADAGSAVASSMLSDMSVWAQQERGAKAPMGTRFVETDDPLHPGQKKVLDRGQPSGPENRITPTVSRPSAPLPRQTLSTDRATRDVMEEIIRRRAGSSADQGGHPSGSIPVVPTPRPARPATDPRRTQPMPRTALGAAQESGAETLPIRPRPAAASRAISTEDPSQMSEAGKDWTGRLLHIRMNCAGLYTAFQAPGSAAPEGIDVIPSAEAVTIIGPTLRLTVSRAGDVMVGGRVVEAIGLAGSRQEVSMTRLIRETVLGHAPDPGALVTALEDLVARCAGQSRAPDA